MIKTADIDKCKYSRYQVGFDRHASFSFRATGLGRNVIIFGINISSSMKIDNGKKYILILGKGSTQGLEHTLAAEKILQSTVKSCLSLHYNETNNYLFVNGKEIHKLKAKDSEIVATPLCLGIISKEWSVDHIKKLH